MTAHPTIEALAVERSGRNYYNEFDRKAAAWLRELIKAGLIPAGDVDERSIEDVTPADLHGYTQCHFFTGIGGWSHALDLAGWPRDRPVWTGSCPCQPFSAAGKGDGFEDERHLWPAWFHLIRECRPAIVFGEQVASKAADAWIDLVQADMESVGNAFGCVPFPAAGVGAPHIRDRNYWLAHTGREGLEGFGGHGDDRHEPGRVATQPRGPVAAAGAVVRLEYAHHERFGEAGRAESGQRAAGGCADGGLADRASGGRREECADGGRGGSGDCAQGFAAGLGDGGDAFRLGHSDRNGAGRVGATLHRSEAGEGGRRCGDDDFASSATDRPGPTNGQWRAADWLGCRDGKWRPVEPGTFPLAHGLPARVGRLRGYGNAIVPAQAAEFIRASVEAVGYRLPVEAAA